MSLYPGANGNIEVIYGSKKEKNIYNLNLIFRKFTAFLMDKGLCLLSTLEDFIKYCAVCFTLNSQCVSAASRNKSRPHRRKTLKANYYQLTFNQDEYPKHVKI